MSLLRVQVTAQQTLTQEFRVDGVLTDCAGNVTCTLKRLDGTTVNTATASHPGLGTYTYVLPAQALLDSLTLDWSGSLAGAAVVVRDYVEIVGGFYFGLDEAKTELGLNLTKYPYTTIARKRIETEQECEAITRQAWVPRFARYLLDGSGTDELVVPDMQLRVCRAAKVADRAGGTFTALTAGQVAAVAADESGVLIRDDGDTWPAGRANVIVEYEHGHDMPVEEIASAAKQRLRSRLGMTDTSVPYRAISFSAEAGGTYRLSTPGPRSTGMPDVDAAYLRHAHQKVWIA
jgi:hypothetical protein